MPDSNTAAGHARDRSGRAVRYRPGRRRRRAHALIGLRVFDLLRLARRPKTPLAAIAGAIVALSACSTIDISDSEILYAASSAHAASDLEVPTYGYVLQGASGLFGPDAESGRVELTLSGIDNPVVRIPGIAAGEPEKEGAAAFALMWSARFDDSEAGSPRSIVTVADEPGAIRPIASLDLIDAAWDAESDTMSFGVSEAAGINAADLEPAFGPVDLFVESIGTLGPGAKARLVGAFAVFDSNSNARISPAELADVPAALGRPTSAVEAASLLRPFDADSDGLIDGPEFEVLAITALHRPGAAEATAAAEATLDIDQNGRIDRTDLERIVASGRSGLTPARFEAIDAGGDDALDFDELAVVASIGRS